MVSFARAYCSLDEATAAVQEHLGRVFRSKEHFDFCLDRITELVTLGMSQTKQDIIKKGDEALKTSVKDRMQEQLGYIAARTNLLKKVNEIVRKIRDALFPEFMSDEQIVAFALRFIIFY